MARWLLAAVAKGKSSGSSFVQMKPQSQCWTCVPLLCLVSDIASMGECLEEALYLRRRVSCESVLGSTKACSPTTDSVVMVPCSLAEYPGGRLIQKKREWVLT
ncbi:hypothetical protein PISMIDRAFT_212142 [Pisolithus microcarpus 441]|uniref:Uncharacterized protein n=1 Tax=Pisolithus microcarpus 441 TaxID=765257 RepID=A0A0C9XZ81_9AGAM|nr:hypothetical protein PISMIDRAFT_212142 [Pisolithus microcarpus 441]